MGNLIIFVDHFVGLLSSCCEGKIRKRSIGRVENLGLQVVGS
jgi:hypothetical protein